MYRTKAETSGLTRRDWLAATTVLAATTLGATKARSETRPSAKGKPIPVAVLLGTGATLIDFAGPWEVLSSVAYAGVPGFDVYSVAASRAPIVADDGRATTHMGPRSGLSVVPDYTFGTAPMPRIVVMGGQADDEPGKLEWIRHVARKAELTTSVCTGAFVLARTGLLDGQQATTNRNAYDAFAKKFPKVRLVRGVRFVESGKFVTATGLTAGIDLALHLTQRFYGRKVAQDIADYEEWPGKSWM